MIENRVSPAAYKNPLALPAPAIPFNARFELLMWQFVAGGTQMVWLVKPYFWIGLITFMAAFCLGYYLTTIGIL